MFFFFFFFFFFFCSVVQDLLGKCPPVFADHKQTLRRDFENKWNEQKFQDFLTSKLTMSSPPVSVKLWLMFMYFVSEAHLFNFSRTKNRRNEDVNLVWFWISFVNLVYKSLVRSGLFQTSN